MQLKSQSLKVRLALIPFNTKTCFWCTAVVLLGAPNVRMTLLMFYYIKVISTFSNISLHNRSLRHSHTKASTTMRAQLTLSAEGLKNTSRRRLQVADPYAVVSFSGGPFDGREVGRTETYVFYSFFSCFTNASSKRTL